MKITAHLPIPERLRMVRKALARHSFLGTSVATIGKPELADMVDELAAIELEVSKPVPAHLPVEEVFFDPVEARFRTREVVPKQ